MLVILRYLRLAGVKGFALCHTAVEFESLIESLPVGTDIEVFRDRQLPLRGRVDQEFIASTLGAIANDQEYLVITKATRPDSRISDWGRTGCSHDDLREDLAEVMGREVAVGLCPHYSVPDHEGLVSAAKGGIDGPR